MTTELMDRTLGQDAPRRQRTARSEPAPAASPAASSRDSMLAAFGTLGVADCPGVAQSRTDAWYASRGGIGGRPTR